MEKSYLTVWITFLATACAIGANLPTKSSDNRCPDGWTPFKDEKCVLIAVPVGLQNQEDAEVICGVYVDNASDADIPKLLTIKSYEEQEFMHDFLFVKNKVIDHVWLGLTEGSKAGVFEWNDDTEIYFSNWQEQNVTDDAHKCVQMESGQGNDPPGIWVKVNCEKRNTVACEQSQQWTFQKLRSTVVNLRLNLKNSIIENSKIEKELRDFKDEAEKKFNLLENHSAAPVGYIFVQLGGQAPPSTLWPTFKWKDVSSSYEGLFFRVVGGKASQFGEVQEESSSRLMNVQWRQGSASTSTPALTELPSDGSWSNYTYTGTSYSGSSIGVRYQLSEEEVRPRNQAIKVWVRIQ